MCCCVFCDAVFLNGPLCMGLHVLRFLILSKLALGLPTCEPELQLDWHLAWHIDRDEPILMRHCHML